MMKAASIVLILIAVVYQGAVYGAPSLATVHCKQSGSNVPICTVVNGIDPTGTATGSFEDDLSVTGWGKLKINTSPDSTVNDTLKMYGAGYLEGVMTYERIEQQIQNLYSLFFGDKVANPKIEQWLDAQDYWTRQKLTDYNSLSSFWKHVALVMSQYDGLVAGYTSLDRKKINIPIPFAFKMLSGWGDFLDIIPALLPTERPNWTNMTKPEISRKLGTRGHCSALIKIPGDFSDIFMAQAAWFSYAGMNRIYKHYQFNVNVPETAAKKISFSSYPGCLVSIDDFYLMDSGLVMLQTTNGIINETLYGLVTPFALLAWQRVRVANSLASDGRTWSNIISGYNSGTYNNQYMVIDLKKFKPGIGLDDGTLWVSEQIPGEVEFADVTEILRYGYWPSYNIPYFPDIWLKSGYNILGRNYSHSAVPRAQIFRRDQGNVVDLGSLKYIMRYNNYKVDPLSHNNPGLAICSRFDLETSNPGAEGCYDAKVTSYSNAIKLVSEAINGPTTQNSIPPFQWTAEWDSIVHEGMPQIFNFDFEKMDPNW